MAELIFCFIVLCSCVFAVLTVSSRDIFHSAIWLALTLLSVCGIYFYLDALFLGVIQILVYIGGIVTLLVFAIKLTAHMGDKGIRQANEQIFVSAIASLILFFFLLKVIGSHPWARIVPDAPSVSLQQLGISFMTTYALPFEFISLLLLAAMVGAIVIGKVKK